MWDATPCGHSFRKDAAVEGPKMKLLCIFAVVAFALAEEELEIPDQVAIASSDVQKESGDILETSASAYSYVPSGNSQAQAHASYVPPHNNYVRPPLNTYVPPQNTYVPPQNSYVPPQNSYVPPQNSYVPPQNSYVPPQNDYYPTNTYYPQVPSSTTTQVPIIKNELTYGDNGSYQYEYQIGDGTHVGEQGYFLYPNTENESIVKKGWYSYPGSDGKTYTVHWWADHTGFHATGDHIPTPPPIPPAIQAALDKKEKEEAQTNKPYYPTYTEKPGYYPTQAPIYPSQPTYRPEQTYYPNNNYYPSQPTYPSQPSYPSQPTYNPSYSSYGKKIVA